MGFHINQNEILSLGSIIKEATVKVFLALLYHVWLNCFGNVF